MVAQVILSCDLIIVADEEKVKNLHGYFIQACSQLKKNLKPRINLLFREILALPVSRLFVTRIARQLAVCEPTAGVHVLAAVQAAPSSVYPASLHQLFFCAHVSLVRASL